MHFSSLIKCNMSYIKEFIFVGDNEPGNLVQVGSFKWKNRGTFSGLLAALPYR